MSCPGAAGLSLCNQQRDRGVWPGCFPFARSRYTTKAKGGEHVAWLLSEAQLLSCSWVWHHLQHYNKRPPVVVNLECQQDAIWGHHEDISGMTN